MAEGKEQRKNTPYGRARIDYRNVYGGKRSNFDINEQEFRFKAIRPDLGDEWIDLMVTGCSWTEDGGRSFNNPVTLTGTLTIILPDDGFKLVQGHEIDCYVRWPGRSGGEGWERLWRMRIQKASISVNDGQVDYELADDTRLLYASTDDWKFAKTKRGRHRDGWRMDEIVRKVASEYHFKASCPKGQVHTKKKTFSNQSPMQVIQWAVEHEAHETGNQYVIRWEDARLTITPVRRNPLLYTFGDLLRTTNVEKTVRGSLATAMKVRWVEKTKKSGKKKGKTKSHYTLVNNRKLQRRYGYIHKEVTAPGRIDSRADAREWAKGAMRRRSISYPTVSFTHPGIAMVRRGDAIRLALPEEGFSGIRKGATGLAFVQTIQHQVSGGDYTMDITLSFRDMLDPEHLKRLKDKALRAKKKKDRDK